MIQNSGFFNNMDNLYNPATDANEVQAFNKNVTFCSSAKDISRKEVAAANEIVAAMIAQTKKEIISNE